MRTACRVTAILVLAGLMPAASVRGQDLESGVRLTDAGRVEPSGGGSGAQGGKPGLANWSRVVALDTGREIVLTRSTLPPSRHVLLQSDAAGLTILDVDDRAIPPAVRDALVGAARDHPDYFRSAQAGRQFALNGHVRIGPNGVLEKDNRLFDLAHVVEIVPRDEVAEVSVMAKHVGKHVLRGLLIGTGLGAALIGVGVATCHGGPDQCSAGWIVVGAIDGAIFGVAVGAIVGGLSPSRPDLIYRR